ncbi:alpha/beta fold hydrolase [Nocardiopsis ganjiahuensis]|uniref:alpha/beta fold hydrolase n=1 Tax=Nocardiopsis ganjiahuensis TaxID=239984 RepID=UPI00034C411C|nr:alpha/beta hydrolase [Nocardiopsis ganjiahuensis]
MTTAYPAHGTGSTASRDGTVLGYRRLGSGPAVVLTHGSLMTSHNLLKLGAALSDRFTVYLPDLRGRGLSGPQGPGHSLERAAEDVAAIVEHTGARGIFGLSGGAVPVLKWALGASEGYRVALYEPPLPTGAFSPTAWLPRYEHEMSQGREAAAMATAAKGTQDPPWLRLVPRTLLVPLMHLGLNAQARRIGQTLDLAGGRSDSEVPLRDLLPTLGPDARTVAEAADLAKAAADVRADVLLLGGTRSARYLKEALDTLETTLPRVRRVEFAGAGHLAADNSGRPERVARALAGFLDLRVSPSARS